MLDSSEDSAVDDEGDTYIDEEAMESEESDN